MTFAATGLPLGATATFSPAVIAANGGPQTVTLTIQTANPATTAESRHPLGRDGAPLALAFLLFPLLGVRRVRRRLRGGGLMLVLLLVAGLAGVASISGCGTANGFNGQAVENYTVTVTATSGETQHSFNVNLNVQ